MKNLTIGNPAKVTLLFLLPICLDNVFQQLYSMVDTIFVGKYIGADAIAATGSTTYIYSFLTKFLFGLCTGFTIITAQYFGSNNTKQVKKTIAHGISMSIIASAILTAIALISLNSLLTVLNTPTEVFDMAREYIKIIIAGTVVTTLYNIYASILRAFGDSVTPLIFLVIASVIHIILDIVFIRDCNMGVAGAAYSTVISQFVSFVGCAIYLFVKFPQFRFGLKDLIFDINLVKEMVPAGIAMSLMLSIIEAGGLVLQAGVNALGTTVITSHTAARKVMSILFVPADAVASAASTYCGQNYGAKKYDRVIPGIKYTIIYHLLYTIIAMAFVLTLGKTCTEFVVSTDDTAIITNAMNYMLFNVPFFTVLSFLAVLRSSFQGINYKIIPVILSIIELLVKAATTLWLAPKMGYAGIIICEPIIWTICSIVALIVFFKSPKLKNIRDAHLEARRAKNA